MNLNIEGSKEKKIFFRNRIKRFLIYRGFFNNSRSVKNGLLLFLGKQMNKCNCRGHRLFRLILLLKQLYRLINKPKMLFYGY